MKDFLLIFRSEIKTDANPTPEEREASTRRWMDWLGSIEQKGQLANLGNRLGDTGRVLRADQVVTNGPYSEIKESIGGYSVVKAASYDDVVELSKGCPIFRSGGSVEIREIAKM